MLTHLRHIEYVKAVILSQDQCVLVQQAKTGSIVVLSDGVAGIGNINFVVLRVLQDV